MSESPKGRPTLRMVFEIHNFNGSHSEAKKWTQQLGLDMESDLGNGEIIGKAYHYFIQPKQEEKVTQEKEVQTLAQAHDGVCCVCGEKSQTRTCGGCSEVLEVQGL